MRATGKEIALSESNKNTVRKLYVEFWNRADWSLADAILHEDYVGNIAHVPEPLRGAESFQHFAALFHGFFPDIQFTLEDQIAEGDRVASRWTARSRHFGPHQSITGISIHRLKDGRVAETWDNWDAVGLLQGAGPGVLETIGLSL
jgi:predicted SnoaL-like aldol condensation-catalyzing enzyme